MAARRRGGTNRSGGNGLPGWAMLTIGLIIGLFVAFLVYLDDVDPEPYDFAATERDREARGVAREGADDPTRAPRFEFYSILPELEVVVPDFPTVRRERDPIEAEPEAMPGEPPPAGLAPVPPADDDARYFLQAGSFREAEQADRLRAEITLLGLDVEVQSVEVNGDTWHRVRIGPLPAGAGLQRAQNRLRENGIDYLVLRSRG